MVVLAAGFAYINGTHRHIPADLRDAVADRDFDTSIPAFDKGGGNIPVPKAAAVESNTARDKSGRRPQPPPIIGHDLAFSTESKNTP